VKASVEPLEGNKVRLSVEVDESEFEKDIDAAFRRLAREVKMPGFRPGKAPRRLLEAKLGKDIGRSEALRHSLPEYYTQALAENDVDAIAAPELEITAGEEEGPIVFDAVVEIRPVIMVGGYENLRVELPGLEATDEDIDGQIERLQLQFSELAEVDRPVKDDDHVTISINGSRDGENIQGLQADDYLYEVGSGSIASELDDNLRGAKVGDVLTFSAQPEDQDEDPVDFRVLVKDVKERVLPEVTDEWANDVSEFDTVDELRGDLADRIGRVRKIQASLALRDRVIGALVELVDDELPEALIQTEMQDQLRVLAMRVAQQGITFEQYVQAVGQEEVLAQLRPASEQAVRADLALRAVAEAEKLEVTDSDVEDEIESVASRLDEKPAKVRQQLERAEGMQAVRSDLRKRKALDWLTEHVELVDEHGEPIDRDDLTIASETTDPDIDVTETEEEEAE
jgi:trigger factor